MITAASDLDQLYIASELASKRLLSEMSAEGLWRGRLSSSAVSTAVASFALAKVSPQDLSKAVLARRWIADHINPDGGWGDTPQSVSNLSATLLSRAALLLESRPDAQTRHALNQSEKWLRTHIGGVTPKCIIDGVKEVYGKDLTFSGPILTLCALSGMFAQEKRAWQRIPRLPFELAVLPHQFYHFLNLPVVSYAIPALIAIGIAQFRHSPPQNLVTRFIRKACIAPALQKLSKLTPTHGGFLEAAPLTAFVAACLGCSGFDRHPVVEKALNFLKSTMRSDGSWPIDTDLSLWLTTLAVKALDASELFSPPLRGRVADCLRSHQFRAVHPFTHARPGGWGWTSLPGSVPDSDDTASALIALALLDDGNLTAEVKAGIEWLLNLMNQDGGVPTFCKGWGLLPFDRSCPDISAHALQAFALWSPHVSLSLQKKMKRAIEKIILYLKKSRDADLVWTPLWFGDQNSPQKTNRVYGTATVLIALATSPYGQVLHLADPAVQWLKKARNSDGGWGGEPKTPSLFETTAQAVAALSHYVADPEELETSVLYLTEKFIQNDGMPPAASIGFYFASLWYDEKLYPLLFGLRALHNVINRHAFNNKDRE